MRGKPMSLRLIDAADTIAEWNASMADTYTANAPWRPSELRDEAMHLAAEEAALEERGWVVDRLAEAIYAAFQRPAGRPVWAHVDAGVADNYRRVADLLIEAGWRPRERP